MALEVGDIDEALAFYRRLFDFELRGRNDKMAFIDMGDQFLALVAGRTQPPDAHRHFGLVVDDRNGLHDRAKAASWEIVDGVGLEIRDPSGNRLEIVECRDLQFAKGASVLEALGTDAEKTEDAEPELRRKGVEI